MDQKKNNIEDFKAAISSTVRSISNSQKIEVLFGNNLSKSEKNSIKLPDLDRSSNKFNFEEIRAVADSKSLNFRFSNKQTFNKYEPKGNISKKLYNISEKIRCEKIGVNYFKGIKNNIENFYQSRVSNLDLKSSEDKIVEAFENFLRIKFLDFKNEAEIEKKFKSYKKDLNEKFKDKISELKESTLDQEKYNSIISQIITDMSLDENINDEQNKDEENEDNEKHQKPQNQDQKAQEKEDKPEEMSIDSGMPDLENEAKESDKAEEELVIENSSRPDLKRKGVENFGDLKYKTFTEEFDEIIKAEELENSEELTRLRKNLDQQLLQLKNFISKLANKLQRKLLAKQNRAWNFDLEEGLLDTSKLSRIIMDPFKRRKILNLKIL